HAAPPLRAAPPPPNAEAAQPSDDPPVAIAGISYESTSASGGFAVAAGNTLGAAPERVARDSRPYKAAQYAAAAELAEAPRVLNGDQVEIRRYYPKDALQRGFEGDGVV